MLSSIDWALIESWKERGVPLHVALRAIEHAFDSHEAKNRKRSVKSLLYCQEEVEAQYVEWLESRTGSHEEEQTEDADQKSPFPLEVVLSHLARSRETLIQLAADRTHANDELSEALLRATTLLAEIESDYATAAHPDARRLEDSLTGIERMLSDALYAVVAPQQLEQTREVATGQLRPYRAHMDAPVYEQTIVTLVLKNLRERYGVPRLSLFYL